MMSWPAKTAVWMGTLALLVGCSLGVQSPGVSPERKHSWEVAFNRGDVATVVALYSPDAQLVMSGSPPARGLAAVRAAVETMMKSGVKVRIGTEQNVGSGDLAYVYGRYSVLDREGGKSVEEGSYVELWRRRNGQWLIDLDVNSVGPGAGPTAEAASNGGGR